MATLGSLVKHACGLGLHMQWPKFMEPCQSGSDYGGYEIDTTSPPSVVPVKRLEIRVKEASMLQTQAALAGGLGATTQPARELARCDSLSERVTDLDLPSARAGAS